MLLPKMLLCCDPPEVLYRTEKRTEDGGLISFSRGNRTKWFLLRK